jgi:Sulfotransferase domain
MNKRIRLPGPCAHLDFLVIGAMKAGSTSLFEFLAAHPSVYVPGTKEPHYFSMRYYYPSSYYRWLFRARGEQQICGEASTSYSNVNRFPRCPERIANDAPNVRIIYIIRDPIERIMSNLRHIRLRGHDIGIDSKAVTDPSLWNKSRYRDTIEAYLEFFPRSRMFVADLHDLRKDDEWLRRVLRFLELDHHSCEKFVLPQSNVSNRRRIASPWVSRIALSPLGALLRDMLPGERIQQLRNLVSSSKQPDDAEISGINADVLRERFPDLCDQLDSQYQWVRKHFIEDSPASSPFSTDQ